MLECLLSVKPECGGEKKMVSKQLRDDLYLLGFVLQRKAYTKGIVHCALCIAML